jgi:hypothetical protein
MPFLSDLAKEHCYHLLENVIGYSFAIQSSMLSGMYPEDNDHWMPYFYSPESSPTAFKTFGKVGSILMFDKLPMIRYLAMWQTRRFVLKKGVQPNNIPSSMIGKMSVYPYYYMCELPFFHELRELLSKKYQTALTYIGPPQTKTHIYIPFLDYIKSSKHEKELVIAYDDKLDMCGHEFGPYSTNCLRYAKFLDSALHMSYQKLKKRFGNSLTFVVFSDHGQCDQTNTLNLLPELAKAGLNIGEEYLCFLDSTLALFWPKNQATKEKIVKRLGEIKMGKVIDEPLQKQYHIEFKNRKYGDIVFALRPGATFFPNSYSPQNALKGLHGYLPEDNVQKALLIADKPFTHNFGHVKDFKDFSLNAFASC